MNRTSQKHTSLLVMAGLACTASAQGTMTYNWVVLDGILEPGETGIAMLMVEMAPGAVGFASSIFDFHHDGTGSYSYDNLPGRSGSEIDDGNGNITNIEAFQEPPFSNPDFIFDNPIIIGLFTITPDDYTPHTITFFTDNHQHHFVYTDEFGATEDYDAIINSGSFRVVPAPVSLAPLALGGLAAGRRRR